MAPFLNWGHDFMTDTSVTPLPLSGLLPQRSVGLKLLLVCALALLMAIPALFTHSIVQDRRMGAQQALDEVSEMVGGQQAVLGPVLAVPYSRSINPKRPDELTYGIAIAYAETGTADASVNVEERTRGIHHIPVFNADVMFNAEFAPETLRQAIPADASAVWSDARLYLGVSDTRGIRDAMRVTVDGRAISIEPAPYNYAHNDAYQPVPTAGVMLAGGEMPGLETTTGKLAVTANIRLSGAERLAIAPFAKDTSVNLSSNWEDPSFQGGVLPESHSASTDGIDGFDAHWRVPYLARGIPGAGANLNLSDLTEWNRRDMAVRFMKEGNAYQSVERALKYAVMFVGFVFLAYFLFEVTSAARAHPAQYVLVGLAQTIFYILLLAIAERTGFDAAFAIAATMTVILTSAYAMSVFRSRAYGLRALGILTGIYTLIYVLMRAESHALLAGALASFAAIALTMYMTRNIDWYGGRSAAPAA